MTYQLEKQSGVIVKNESMCKKGSSTTVIIEVATLYAQGVTYFSHELMKLDPHVAMLGEERVECHNDNKGSYIPCRHMHNRVE